MPAFVAGGPEIPERLIHAHEEGRVVFFCGAGISYPAGLPGFKGLVENVFDKLGTSRDKVEEAAFDNSRFDETLDLLERRYPGGRLKVREVLAESLNPQWRRRGAKDTHLALLKLAQDDRGVLRLVTTNFDRIFEVVKMQLKLKSESFRAPMLPIPKASKWDGIVYLHGLLSKKNPSASELNRLVVTSGDFGLAYLSERWASRFVSQLLRGYTVCFVGYSIEDPVLRYMMDALAADEMLGEKQIEAFAFAATSEGEEETSLNEWKAKGVTPMLFNVPSGTYDYSALHLTLQAWAQVYTTGAGDKRMIVSEHAPYSPVTSSRSDYAVGRLLWALTDWRAAKNFADLNPAPPLTWLKPLIEVQFDSVDLSRFGVREELASSKVRAFSFFERPAPSVLSPPMRLVCSGGGWSNWDEVMHHLSRWLIRHLDDPGLILWIAEQGGRLHPRLQAMVERRVRELVKYEDEGNESELARIRDHSPKGIPGKAMRKLWQLVLGGRLKGFTERGFYGWFSRLAVEGLTVGLKMELFDHFRLCVGVAKPYQAVAPGRSEKEDPTVGDLVRWEVVFATDHLGAAIRDRQSTPNWQESLPDLLDDFQKLLKEALGLMLELSGLQERRRLSILDLPSISRSAQNREFHQWTALVTVTRDAWVATLEKDPERAKQVAREWWCEDYPLFKRMALFAAAQKGSVDETEAIAWLVSDDAEWLWSVETKRESLRLLVELSNRWEVPPGSRRSAGQVLLERAIMKGPEREEDVEEESDEEFMQYQDRQVWLRLEKLSSGAYRLGRVASARLRRLRRQNKDWKVADNESDEFAFWMEVTSGPSGHISTPTEPRDLVAWLKEHPTSELTKDDEWRDRCRTHFDAVAEALEFSRNEGSWYPKRVDEALHVWSGDEKLLKLSWRHLGDFVGELSDDRKIEIKTGLAWWLNAGSAVFDNNERRFFSLVNDLLRLGASGGDDFDRDIMFDAINHPVGQATEAVMKWWYREPLKLGETLQGEIRKFFSKICDTDVVAYRRGRVILARATVALFRVDPEWTKQYLIPLFDWEISKLEAKVSWIGFLHSPQRIPGLLAVLKKPFLTTVEHLNELGECGDVYAQFFAFVSLESAGVFSREERRTIFDRFTAGELEQSAKTLSDVMDGAGEKSDVLWRESICPFILEIWPKSADRKSGQISGHFAEICIAAGKAFPDAVTTLLHYFEPIQWPTIILDKLVEKQLQHKFPKEALEMIERIIAGEPDFVPRSIGRFLEDLGQAAPNLKRTRKFQRLKNLNDR